MLIADLADYGRALTGAGFTIPATMHWTPSRSALRHLLRLYRAAIRAADKRPAALADPDAAHGLEQQLIHALVECLSAGSAARETTAARHRREIVARFDEAIVADPMLAISGLSNALGVSKRLLRRCCQEQLGMGPVKYHRLRRLSLARHSLRRRDVAVASVTAVARQHGFNDLGRFSVRYRALFGETPSVTLGRSGA